jgi:hypothetical protein
MASETLTRTRTLSQQQGKINHYGTYVSASICNSAIVVKQKNLQPCDRRLHSPVHCNPFFLLIVVTFLVLAYDY